VNKVVLNLFPMYFTADKFTFPAIVTQYF